MIKSKWFYDISSSITVFLVALPLCLGIALASNTSLISGILSGIVGGMVVGFISGSHVSVSGPSAALASIIVAQILVLGSFEAFLIALIIAGLIQIIMGLFKIGFISAFFPNSVIKGLLFSVGVIIVLKQLPHLVGLDLDYEGDMSFWQLDHENTFSEIIKMFSFFHTGCLIVGMSSLAFIVGWSKFTFSKKVKIPSALLVVLFGSFLGFCLPYINKWWFIDAEHLVQVPLVASLHDIKNFFTLPNFIHFNNPEVYIAGFTLALVASLETLLNLEAVDKIDPKGRKSPANRELIAQGIGNLVLGFIGGLPVTSAVIRSSVNINAKAQSKLSAILHGFFLLFFVTLFPILLNYIPLSCLAAILIVTGAKLANLSVIKQMWQEGFNQFLPFLITFLAIMFSDLLIGVMIGLATSIFFILKGNLKTPIKICSENHPAGERKRMILSNQVSFLNRASLNKAFDSITNGSHLVIDATETNYIDSDILDLIKDFKDSESQKRDIIISLIGFKDSYDIENFIQYEEHITPELQKNLTPLEILNIIKQGNERVIKGQKLRRDLNRQIQGTKEAQFPMAVVLSCIDSRVPVELIFDLGIGDAFSVRMAGNVISPKVLGSLEFSCAVAKAKLIVVMGHTKCGAVAAAIECLKNNQSIEEKTGCYNLGSIINDIQRVIDKPLINQSDAYVNEVVKYNVLQVINDIKNKSLVLDNLLKQNKIAIVGCIYDVSTGKVEFLDLATDKLFYSKKQEFLEMVN
jgi:MFS superfamily sulfate permease-like transporter